MVCLKVHFWLVKGYFGVILLQKAVMIQFRKRQEFEEVVHWNF
ncbi:hypothetical protein CLOSTHATH_02112 [Hungatella hathewayi DSM 13479]|uniref:Uncharacterized protein n=1 Tax=Hungatella hathewayi DSM 13479 TaxID=566550 RepID=D3AES8_9FIRM|nr:hypothetical protein CLOSTHATH_02112 [Hungatella hathewayi DSM 13479]